MSPREVTNDDAELVAQALAGDRDAFAAIYDRYADRIHDFCRATLRSNEEAADATQETFMLAWQHLARLRDPARVRAWLYAIARHEALRRARRSAGFDLQEPPDMAAPAAESPELQVEEAELRELVWAAAGGLEPRDRAVLDLSVRQGLDGAELADALGVRREHAYVLASNVRKRVERALGALLVARLGRRDCPELAAMLADWDGAYAPDVRRRVTRHVDSCETCFERRRALASPIALLATVPIATAPAILRDRTLGALETRSGTSGGRSYPPGLGSTRRLAVGGVALATAVAAAGVFAALSGGGSSDSRPTTTTTAASEDFCEVAAEWVETLPRNASGGAKGPASPAPEDVEDYFRTNAEYLGRLKPLAPDAIAADTALLSRALDALLTQLEAADFSLAAAPAAGDDPALDAASERLESFIENSCGVG